MHTRNITVGQHTLSIETGRLAKQADGAVIIRSGDTMVLVSACAAPAAREGIDFLPLTVDYREYTYASGRIPGGFFKREGKPSEKEVLTSRFIDRPIRPLFPSGWLASGNAGYRPRPVGSHRERQRRARDYGRVRGARALEHSVHANDCRRADGTRGWTVCRQPDVRRASEEPPGSDRRWQQGRH